VKAIKLGAYDYLSKPFELEQLDLAIEKAFRTIDLEMVEQFQEYRSEKESEEAVITGGGSEIMKQDLADRRRPVLSPARQARARIS
jgi:DNA-binding NtrC family response regulator